MVKLDLALVLRPAEYQGQSVPKELDRQMVIYTTGLRKREVEANPSLIRSKPYDHSDIFYNSRTHLNKLGYDTSVYNDNVVGGSDRRKSFYEMIKDVCENYHKVKRHQIGIFPDDRAVMAFDGRYYSVGFESLKNLMHKGTDVIVVEKAGTVLKMVPYTENRGLAFIQSQGFVSEYGIALSLLSTGNSQASIDYMHCKVPKYIGHLGVLMDCDSSGVLIGLKIPGAVKIGLDLESITEMIEFNKNLGIDLTSKLEMNALVEGTRPNSHWEGLNGIINRNKKSKAYMDLYNNNPMDVFDINSTGYLDSCIEYLGHYVEDQDGNYVRFIDWLQNNRIELNTVLAAAGSEPFWNWLKFKLMKVWPDRDYNRVLHKPNPSDVYTTQIRDFIERLDNAYNPLIDTRYEAIEKQLSKIKYFIKDTDGTRLMIQNRMSKQIATDEKINMISTRLEALADELNI